MGKGHCFGADYCGTVEIAKEMGAKVYEFPWIDDFAAAKNFAINQATGDWIAFLDADEYLLPEDCQKVVKVLNTFHILEKKYEDNEMSITLC